MHPVLRLLFLTAVALAGSACTDADGDPTTGPGAGGTAGAGAGGSPGVGGSATGGAGKNGTGGAGGTSTDAGADADAGRTFDPDAPYPRFCDLPGSLQFTAGGVIAVGGAGDGIENLRFMTLPQGFCVHLFGNVGALTPGGLYGGNPRQMRFSPSGDLFVASPTTGATGGGVGGLDAILILPDDNKDGFADTAIKYIERLPSTQGMMFANDQFYYQDIATILRVPYQPGDRKVVGPPSRVIDTSVYYTSPLHWPKTLDQADDGTIYVANGSDQDEICSVGSRPFVGGVLRVDGTPNGKPVSKGFRNPIAIRCQRGHNLCFASELAKDYSAQQGGREKLVPIREGDDWGFPCCATKNLPHSDIPQRPDCSAITPEDVSFFIGDTPFGFDFERGLWPSYKGSAFVALHGAAGSWTGARVVAVATDPATGRLMPGTNIDGGVSSGAMSDFITGYDDNTRLHGRPGGIEFAADGRMFVSNTASGDIVWVAPLDLPR